MPDANSSGAPQVATPPDQRGVIVFPDLMSTGDGFNRVSLKQAFTERQNTDAMFACYEGHARRRKKSEPEATACRWLAIDIDALDGKRTWESEEHVQIVGETMLADITKTIGVPVVFYSTRHGLRAVWGLERPATGGEWEATWEWVVGKLDPVLKPMGYQCDPQAKDWTRLFRLPLVLRSGVQTWGEPHFLEGPTRGSALLPPAKAARAPERLQERTNPRGRVHVNEEALGQVEDARVDVWGAEHAETPVSRPAATTLARLPEQIQQILKLEIPLQTTEQCIAAGYAGRDSALVGLAGTVVRYAVLVKDMSPRACFGLMAPVIYQMDPDEQGVSWADKTRAKVAEYWSRDYTSPDLLAKVADAEPDEVLDHYEPFMEVLRQIQSWLRTVGLPATLKDAWDYYVPRFVTATGKGQIAIWTGRNQIAVGAASNLLPNMLRNEPEHPMRLFQKDKLMFDGMDGNGRPVSRPRKAAEFTTTFQGDPNKLPMAVDNQRFVENIQRFETDGTFYYERPRFVFAEGLEPKYNEIIDQFLRNALGPNYGMFVAYMKIMPDIDKALPLIILYGDSQQGKSYIANGICALFGDVYWRYTDKQATNFNGERAYSPMVMIEENFGSYWTSETLREQVNHSQHVRVEAKGKDAVMIESASRIIKCSNSLDQDLRELLRERNGKQYRMVESLKVRDAVAKRVRAVKVLPKDPDLQDPLTVYGSSAGNMVMRQHLLWVAYHARLEGVDPADYYETFNIPAQNELAKKIKLMSEVTASVYEGPVGEVMLGMLTLSKQQTYPLKARAEDMGPAVYARIQMMHDRDERAAIVGHHMVVEDSEVKRLCAATDLPTRATIQGLQRTISGLSCTESLIDNSDPGRNRVRLRVPSTNKKLSYRVYDLNALVGNRTLLADDVDEALDA